MHRAINRTKDYKAASIKVRRTPNFLANIFPVNSLINRICIFMRGPEIPVKRDGNLPRKRDPVVPEGKKATVLGKRT